MKNIIFLTFLFLLINANVLGQVNTNKDLINAIRDENFDVLETIIDSLNINAYLVENKRSLLIFAIENNSPEVVEFLLKKNANPNQTYHSRTPLMYAVQKQNLSVIRLLIKFGAAINEKDSLGNTALMIASTGSKLNVVKVLIQKGASLNYRNKKGLNARDFAVRSNNKSISGYLKNIFEKNLPNYFDGPYVKYVSQKKIKVSYLKHDSLRRRTESLYQFFKLRNINNQFSGFAGDKSNYLLTKEFERPPSEINNIKKLLIIGDVHGQYDTLRLFLQNNKVIDHNLHWTFGNGTVVFIGDIFDRGEKVTEALWLIYRLEKEAADQGGMVHLLLGNHELMVFHEDERYISEKYFYLFKNLKFSYSRYYNNKTLLGKWLRSRNTFLKVDSFLFVHGGLHPNILKFDFTIDSANNLINKYLNAKRKIAFSDNSALKFLLSYNGPFWFRGLVEQTDVNNISNNEVEELLSAYKVKHIVVGHTFKPEIKTFFEGKVISTDVPFYLPDGYPMQALLLQDQKFVILNSKGEKKDFYLQ